MSVMKPSWLKLKKPLKVKADAEGIWILSVQTPGARYDAHTITLTDGKEVKELTNIDNFLLSKKFFLLSENIMIKPIAI